MSEGLSIKEWCEEVHEVAISKGWHDPTKAPDADKVAALVALAHSELSEALEELRNNGVSDLSMRVVNGKPEGFVVEMADVVIRICDTCERLGLDLQGAMVAKTDYNQTRPIRHGGKAL